MLMMNMETHQVDRGVQLGDEFSAALLGVLDSGHRPGVRPLPQLGGE